MPWDAIPSSGRNLTAVVTPHNGRLEITFYTGWIYEYRSVPAPVMAKLNLPTLVNLTDELSAETLLTWWNRYVRRLSYGQFFLKTPGTPPTGISIIKYLP